MTTDQGIRIMSAIAIPMAAFLFGWYQFRSTVEIGRQQADRDLKMKFVDFTWSAIKDGDTATVYKALRVLGSVDRNAAIELADVVYRPLPDVSKNVNLVSMVAMHGLGTIPITFRKIVPLTTWESASYQTVRRELLRRFPKQTIDETRVRRMGNAAIRSTSYLTYGTGEKPFAIAFQSMVDSSVVGLSWELIESPIGKSGLILLLNNPEQ